MEIMSFNERSLSLSSGEQVRGRVIAPLCSVALSYTSYKKILSLPRLLTEADTPLFLGGEDRVFIYVRVDSTHWEKWKTQKDSGTEPRGSTIFGFGMKPAVDITVECTHTHGSTGRQEKQKTRPAACTILLLYPCPDCCIATDTLTL